MQGEETVSRLNDILCFKILQEQQRILACSKDFECLESTAVILRLHIRIDLCLPQTQEIINAFRNGTNFLCFPILLKLHAKSGSPASVKSPV